MGNVNVFEVKKDSKVLSELPSSGVLETFEITPNSTIITDGSIRINSNYYNPLTRMVFINFEIYSASKLIPGDNQRIATIPSKYKPSSLEQRYANVQVDLSGSQARTEDCYIDSNGKIAMNNFVVGQDVKLFTFCTVYTI